MKRLLAALCLIGLHCSGQAVSQLPAASAMHTNDLFSVSQPTGNPAYTSRSLTGGGRDGHADGHLPIKS